jgi:hypothetical protein
VEKAAIPSPDRYVAQVDKEHRWLPILAPQLPLPIPRPLVRGIPGSAFPRPWSVYGWLAGRHATMDRIGDLNQFATDLASLRFGWRLSVRHVIEEVIADHKCGRRKPTMTHPTPLPTSERRLK